MKLIELHILQSFPVSCLNRDEVGSPKSAIFGGVKRARISSQCLKRAARIYAKENGANPEKFAGLRTRLLQRAFGEALERAGFSGDELAEKVKEIAEVFSKIKEDQVTTAVFLSPGEVEQIAALIAEGEEPKKAAKKAERLDAADISLFGRMVANDASLNVEGAALFSHALSTHKADNEVDFFSAVDDLKTDAEDAGAGMIGSLEYNSATYYRYAAVNLDLLGDEDHLGRLGEEDRRAVLDTFIRSVLLSVPGARKNSMNAATLPHDVLGIRKSHGQPLQLVNAFEEPVKSRSGIAGASREAMSDHLLHLEGIWGPAGEKQWLTESENGLEGFINFLLD